MLPVMFLISCSVPRPKGLACVADVDDSVNICYNMETDFDGDGNVLPTAKPTLNPLLIDKHINFDPDSWASMKSYIRALKSKQINCGK